MCTTDLHVLHGRQATPQASKLGLVRAKEFLAFTSFSVDRKTPFRRISQILCAGQYSNFLAVHVGRGQLFVLKAQVGLW